MAIVKNGKIRGRIGNYVYRVVNGKEVIQSAPRMVKLSANTKIQNGLFAACGRMNGRIYRLVKEFAVNAVDAGLCNKLMKLMKKNFYSADSIHDLEDFHQWKLLVGSVQIQLNKNYRVDQIVNRRTLVRIENNRCKIDIRAFDYIAGYQTKLKQDAKYIEYSVWLMHYDFEQEMVELIYQYDSGRQLVSRGYPAQQLEVDLDGLESPVEKGLLIACFGLRFFTAEQSYGYLNSADFNPCEIAGMWFKK